MGGTKRVLALGAHTDDIELGCGATLRRLVRDGAAVSCIAFSRAEESLPQGSPVDLLETEFRASMAVLGCNDVRVLEYPVRRFTEFRQQILDVLIAIRSDLNPDVVFTHSCRDGHQDHEVISRETRRAFRGQNVLAYACPWNQTNVQSDLFIEVSESDVMTKVRMLERYASQRTLGRGYVSADYVRSSAIYAGQQSRMEYAEAFEVHRIAVRLNDDI